MDKAVPTTLFISGLTKRFGPIIALRNITIKFLGGEIHVILGENGAGKTTLAKILSGIYRLDEGEIYINNNKIQIRNTRDALKNGIAIVSQYPKLIEELTVGENLLLALDRFRYLATPSKLVKEVEKVSRKYGISIDLKKHVYSLSFSERQRVEILKALLLNPTVLILDEPTTLLTEKEKKSLYNFINRLKEDGKIVIVITHKIDEALDIADRITILKGGSKVGTFTRKELDKQLILERMFGGESIKHVELSGSPIMDSKESVLVARNISVIDDYGYKILENVNLEARVGEVLGVVGMAGTGLRELGETLYGLRPYKDGEILILNKRLREYGRDELSNLVGFIPDNILMALVLDLNVDKNYRLKKRLWEINKENIQQIIRKFRIKVESPEQIAGTLSGGNLQKLVVSRELSIKPKLLIAINPTKALDHMSISTIHSIFREYTAQGGSIILLSEDMDEVLEISDKVSVISEKTLKPIKDKRDIKKKVMELLT